MIVGCYQLQLYCDTGHRKNGTEQEYDLSGPWDYTGQTLGQCMKDARKDGWLFKRDGRVFCAQCVKDGRATAPKSP